MIPQRGISPRGNQGTQPTCVFVDRVDSLHVPRHHLDTGFLRAVSREKLMVRLQVEHAGSFPGIYGRALVQMPRDPISAARAADGDEK